MNHQLQNKRALVTGGRRGIGAAIVKRLARDGAHVALTYVSKPHQANEKAMAARALGVEAIAIQADNLATSRCKNDRRGTRITGKAANPFCLSALFFSLPSLPITASLCAAEQQARPAPGRAGYSRSRRGRPTVPSRVARDTDSAGARGSV
jgi:NAD(P)-dependent dehydrogenase (short-subunit alcohol dehydrogenase family)